MSQPNINALRTIPHYAKMVDRTPSHIYALGRGEAPLMNFVYIDEVPFVDITMYPKLPTKPRKKRKEALEDDPDDVYKRLQG